MPKTHPVPIDDLTLDLKNFRTVHQSSEAAAVHSMISINPDRFWALMENLLDEGYHPTENILVLRRAGKKKMLIVKEGNRRIGALKIVFGILNILGLDIPAHLRSKISNASEDWKLANRSVPCAIYEASEEAVVDRIITLTHGKGEKAARDPWTAIARARHGRDKNGQNEPALDFLEKYLKHGKNLSPEQAERWSGDYPLSVLAEALTKIAPRIGRKNAREVANDYPDTPHKKKLEEVTKAIGWKDLDFAALRNSNDLSAKYGFPAIPSDSPESTEAKPTASEAPAGPDEIKPPSEHLEGPKKKRVKAVPLDDPRSVMRALRGFEPKGPNRAKLVTLVNEALLLKLNKHPFSFCFLLRSMFEISAKAYCNDHRSQGGPKYLNPKGADRNLAEVLEDVYNHLTKSGADIAMDRRLHGAMTTLKKKHSVLSIVAMNQLVHNPNFSIGEADICRTFANIFPLLEEMNR